jgi:hypothetical protein
VLECVLVMLGINSDTTGSAFGVSSPVSHPFDGHQSALSAAINCPQPCSRYSVILIYSLKSEKTGLYHPMMLRIRHRPVQPEGGP